MDIIDNYLDTMFASYPLTPRTVEAKSELRAMMEDIYNGAIAAGQSRNEAVGQALAEFGNMEEVAAVLGDPSGAPIEIAAQFDRNRPAVSMAQARNFAAVSEKTRWLLGWAVAIFVLAPAPLVSLSIATSDPNLPVSKALASTIGIVILLPLVAIGVGLLVWRNQKLEPFNLITQGQGHITPEVEVFGAAVRREHSNSRTMALIIAIVLWILAGIPLISMGVFTQDMPQPEADQYLAVGMAITLVMVAIGLLAFLPANWANSVANRLSEEGMAEAREDTSDWEMGAYPTWVRAFMAGYWPIMVTIYLTWSFIGDAWGTSWILWPIAGVAFGAISAILYAVYRNRDTELGR